MLAALGMNLMTGDASGAYFGGDVPAAARELLQRAARASARDRETLLWTAHAIAPHCLAVYYALCKHHAMRRELAQAQAAAQRGLAEAAEQAGLDAHGRPLLGDATVDFRAPGAARFWLFTQKALAFIALRAGRCAEAQARLDTILRVEPDARLGDEVVAGLLEALRERSRHDGAT